MSRRRRGTNAQEFVKDDLKKHLMSLLVSRRKLLAPFPADPMQLYDTAWTTEERMAIETLKPYGCKMFDLSDRILLTKIGHAGAKYTIAVKLPEPLPTNKDYGTAVEFKSLPKEMQRPIGEWFPKWLKYDHEIFLIMVKLDSLARHCKTYGQLYRIWPDILSLLGARARDAVLHARAKSKLPESVRVFDRGARRYTDEIIDEFKPEQFEPFTAVIAEALMLPFDEKAGEHEIAKIEAVG